MISSWTWVTEGSTQIVGQAEHRPRAKVLGAITQEGVFLQRILWKSLLGKYKHKHFKEYFARKLLSR